MLLLAAHNEQEIQPIKKPAHDRRPPSHSNRKPLSPIQPKVAPGQAMEISGGGGSSGGGGEGQGKWTDAEDKLIRQWVSSVGKQWKDIAEKLPGRSVDAVRQRYRRIEAGSSSGGSLEVWTEKEDEIVLRAVAEVGTHWVHIAEVLPGRSDDAVRNRYRDKLSGGGGAGGGGGGEEAWTEEQEVAAAVAAVAAAVAEAEAKAAAAKAAKAAKEAAKQAAKQREYEAGLAAFAQANAEGPTDECRRWLRAASSSLLNPMKVSSVFYSVVSLELEWLKQQRLLDAELAQKLIAGFKAAAMANWSKGPQCSNSAGHITRGALTKAGAKLNDLFALLRVLDAHPVSVTASYDDVALYGMIHEEPRSEEQAAYFVDRRFEDGYLAVKIGDTGRHFPRFDKPKAKLQSVCAGRYGGKVYDTVIAEFYFVGSMTRAQRVVTEVAAGWVASEELEGFAPHPGTGDEGFYGKATPEEAYRALEKVRTRLAECDVFKKVLGGARGSRSLAGEWHRSE